MSVTDRLGTDNGAPYPLLLDRRTDSTTNTPAALRDAGTYDTVKGNRDHDQIHSGG